MQEWLIHTLTAHPYAVYLIIAVLSSIEGPILSLVGGVLIHAGYFPFLPLYITLMIGDMIGDTFWYSLGYFFGHGFIRRFGKYVSITEENVEHITKIFHRYTYRILFISKITMGFGFALATLMAAGMAKISFSKYMLTNVVGQFIWTGLLIAVGYFLGQVYTQVNDIIGKISVVALFIIVILALNGYRAYLKKHSAFM
jgi:membrane protein DedA with SNARE-associated domain